MGRCPATKPGNPDWFSTHAGAKYSVYDPIREGNPHSLWKACFSSSFGDREDEDHGTVAAASEQEAIGVEPHLEHVTKDPATREGLRSMSSVRLIGRASWKRDWRVLLAAPA